VAEAGLRARKKAQARERILAVCERLFRERGFDETTVDEIAARADISRQTFFNYFAGKEAALAELGFAWLRTQTELPQRGLEAIGERSPLEVVRIGIRGQLEAIERDRDFMRLVFTRSGLLFPQGPQVGTEADAARIDRTHDLFAAVAALMRAGQQAGGIRDDVPAEQAAEIYVAVLVITIRLWLTGYWGDTESLVERGLRALDVLEDGLRAERASGTAGRSRPRGGAGTKARPRARRGAPSQPRSGAKTAAAATRETSKARTTRRTTRKGKP